MLTRDDLVDIIVSHLKSASPGERAPGSRHPPFELKGRPFLAEYDIKKRLTGGKTRLTLPKEAIISPLAQDWLILNKIEVIRE